MSKGLSYADAVVLLGGGPRNPVLAALDRLTGGVLLAASATGAAFPLSLFDAKAELFRLSDELVGSITGQLRRAKRATRTERLAAANSVLVIAAFFESMRAVRLPFDLRELEITSAEQVAVVAGTHPGRELAGLLLRASVPMPGPQQPYEDTLAELSRFYDGLARNVLKFVSGLEVWERLPDRTKMDTAQVIREEVTPRAVKAYGESFQRLAAEFPEVAFWSNLVDHQATRAQLRELRIALGGLADTLTAISTGSEPDEVRTRLARSYQAQLRRPALAGQNVPGGLRVPVTEESYINPDFRVGVEVSVEDVGNRGWWTGQPRQTDLQGFLVGYLTSPAATTAPLVVMGQPGSGKSLLTRVLAARLPASDFLAVRVPLRELDADADLQTTIEQAIHAATGENLTWPKLVRVAGDATPVVLIDGFDELLQATGRSQSNYLEKVAAFQQREADWGRPVVVVVTTRMSVAHRARPVEGMVTVLLEPFDDDQIARWLTVWNDTNAEQFAARDLRPLPVEVVLEQRDLAAQPLLLLMLALYDAEGNPLQRREEDLDEAELYERLLTAFARREVLKAGAELTEEQLATAINHQLRLLSIVAFAMFNRQQLWVSEADLDLDLGALSWATGDGEPARLTAAQLVVGRFYFVHVAQAVHGATRMRTFEFLHGTFGEYLIARLVVEELAAFAPFLHTLFSFAPLTTQPNTVSFIRSLVGQRIPDRERLVTSLLGQFRDCVEGRQRSIVDYEPVRLSVPARYAAYSANLFLLTVIAAGEVTADQLFPDDPPVAEWGRTARLWQSQFPAEAWFNLVQSVTVTREWDGQNRQVRISLGVGEAQPPDPYWTYDFPPDSRYRSGGDFSWIQTHHDVMRAEAAFLCAVNEDIYVHAFEPLFDRLGKAITTFHDFRARGPVSAAQALITLWLRTNEQSDQLADAAETCVRIAMSGFAPFDKEARQEFRVLVLKHLATIRGDLPDGWVDGLHRRFAAAPNVDEQDELLELTKRIIG